MKWIHLGEKRKLVFISRSQSAFHLYGMQLLFAIKQISMAGEDNATGQTFLCADLLTGKTPSTAYIYNTMIYSEMLVNCLLLR